MGGCEGEAWGRAPCSRRVLLRCAPGGRFWSRLTQYEQQTRSEPSPFPPSFTTQFHDAHAARRPTNGETFALR